MHDVIKGVWPFLLSQLASSDAQVRRVPRKGNADALDLRWQNTWFTSLRLVADYLGAPPPVAPAAGAYLLVEVGAPAGPGADPLTGLAAAIEGEAGVIGAAVATSGRARRLWRWRAHSEAGATAAWCTSWT
jgi:hypothetical protein